MTDQAVIELTPAAGPARRLRGDRGVAGRAPAPPAKPGTATARAIAHRASRIGSVISRGR